jgi:hypothetical protein
VSEGILDFALSARPHASHTPFEVRRRLVVSFIMPHIGYGGIVYAGGDAASQRRLNMAFSLRYIKSLRRLDHVSRYDRIQLLSFLYKVLHVRHPCYLFSLFRFASSARTRNLVVPAHLSLAMSQVLCCTWVPGVECAASCHEDFAYAGFICFRCGEDGPWR